MHLEKKHNPTFYLSFSALCVPFQSQAKNMERDSTRPGFEDPIEVCRRLLGLREFTLCRIQAHMARESDPNSLEVTQILAIADVLLAAESRIADGRLDFYAILQVTRPEWENGPMIRNQFKKLMMLLSPSKNRFPFSQEAFDFICQAWSVLSRPEKKAKYDLEIANAGATVNTVGGSEKQKTHGANDGGGGGNAEKQKDETFWTLCPYCCCLYEYAKAYKELCLRCQNCRRAFHGMEVGPLPTSLTANGVNSYICQMGVFRFGYPWNVFFSAKENNAGSSVGGTNTVVEHSDDYDHDDDDSGDNSDGNEDAENGEIGVKPEVTKQETVNREGIVMGRLNGKRVKMTAWNTKKGMEMRMRMQMKKRKMAESTA